MDYEEIIEKIYDISAVEGVAWFENQATLSDNQLAISESAVMEIGRALYDLRANLKGADRHLKGLLLKTESQTFMSYIHGENLILLQLDILAEVDGVYTSLKSLLGDSSPEVPQAYAIQTSHAVVHEKAATAEPIQDGSPIIAWHDFHASLLSCFKRVAPVQLAKKMLNDSANEVGVSADTVGVTIEQATAVALAASEKVPNEARRALIKKELQTILEKFSK